MQKRTPFPRWLYHLSPCGNKPSIMEQGLLPARAKSNRQRVWLCEVDQIERIAQHLRKPRGIDYVEFDVFVVRCLWLYQISRHPSPGVWLTIETIHPKHIEYGYVLACDSLGCRQIDTPISLLSRSS